MSPYQPSNNIKEIFASQDSLGLVLLTLFLDLYGPEALEWDPATIQMEIEQDYGIDMPAGTYDRLITAISLYTTNSFYVSLPDFSRACVVLSGHHVTPELLVLPEAADIAWGVTEGVLISPPDEEDENPFVPEIVAFIGKVLDSEGILNPPDVLRIATRDHSLVDRVNYDYSDDPEMFGSIFEMEAGKTDDVNHFIKSRLRFLLMQLSVIPLKNGNSKDIALKLLAKLPSDKALPMPE